MARHSRTARTYLSQIYFDDDKIGDFALREFSRCLRAGQMTAFVGSMTTEGLGYPNWGDLLGSVRDAVRKVLNEAGCKASDFEKKWVELRGGMEAGGIDPRVTASAIGHWIENATDLGDAGTRINSGIADHLISISEHAEDRSILTALIDDLGIRRFVTTNYDMELEFTVAGLQGKSPEERHRAYDSTLLMDILSDRRDPHRRWPLVNGLTLGSDAFERDRLDRLIEFTAGSPDIDYHVMHLHGRVDHPAGMVVSYRDYDRLYRKAGVSKLPFDQALAMMYSTNPVLFVGVGMSEGELNRSLEELVGNQPFKGIGRRFLLWSSWDLKKRAQEATQRSQEGRGSERVVYREQDVRNAFRLEKLHKLGVLTIFDDERFDDELNEPVRSSNREPNRKEKREGIARSIRALAKRARAERDGEGKKINEDTAWRKIDFKGSRTDQPINFTWHFDRSVTEDQVWGKKSIAISGLIETPPLVAATSRPGTRKGERSTATAFVWAYSNRESWTKGRHVLFVNTSLRLDTDSVLELLYRFLFDHSGLDGNAERHKAKRSRDDEFRENVKLFFCKKGEENLIIFRGLERLFSKTGTPLSAELDRFFRCYIRRAILQPDQSVRGQQIVRILVLGTRRMRLYFKRIEDQVAAEAGPLGETAKVLKIERENDCPEGYLRHLRRKFALEALVDSDESPSSRTPVARLALGSEWAFARQTYDRIFNSEQFRTEFSPGSADERLAFAILIVMAFIGQPVEREVLFHAPRVAQELGENDGRARLNLIVKKLKRLSLIFEVGIPCVADLDSQGEAVVAVDRKAHVDVMTRYALHVTLQAEMRERFGVPISEAVLSTSFNMSLFVSQPSDGAIAEPSVHDELGRLIDWFLGIHKDSPFDPAHDDPTVHDPQKKAKNRLGRPHAAAAFRAALAIVRGFYSTSSLLSLDVGDRRVDEHRDGALTEHAHRLERMLRAFDKLRKARRAVAEGLSESDTKARIGPGPIYPDELVWLYNELGVVKLAQGDLFEARFNLDEADRINCAHVEFDSRSHNWRRIWLNQLVVDIERGELTSAEDRIGRIENSIEPPGSVETIRVALRDATAGIAPRLPLDITHEDCLSAALTTGFRGLVMHLRGEIHSAGDYYALAIDMLEKLDEQRSCALFRSHYAALLHGAKGLDEGHAMAKLAVAGAESVQQMDLVYRARIVRHFKNAVSNEASRRKRAMLSFAQAIEFADLTDNHRVGVEARRAMAKLKLENGDLESALEHASIGMALAGRYGMTLHAIALRTVLGQILHERGAHDAARALIQNAISYADRVGYQRAVEGAQEALARISRG